MSGHQTRALARNLCQLASSSRRSCEILPAVSRNARAVSLVVEPAVSAAAIRRWLRDRRLHQAAKSKRQTASSAGVARRSATSNSCQVACVASARCRRLTEKPCVRCAYRDNLSPPLSGQALGYLYAKAR